MSNNKKSNSGCFSTILRRILCSEIPQTHPDQTIELENLTLDDPKQENESKSQLSVDYAVPPSIVARLMGLDSLPNSTWVQKRKSSDLVTRSKSVNFMDYLLNFDQEDSQNHRAVKSSISFREVTPAMKSKQKHEFVFSWMDKIDEGGRIGSKSARLRGSSEELEKTEIKQSKAEKVDFKEDREENSCLKYEKGGVINVSANEIEENKNYGSKLKRVEMGFEETKERKTETKQSKREIKQEREAKIDRSVLVLDYRRRKICQCNGFEASADSNTKNPVIKRKKKKNRVSFEDKYSKRFYTSKLKELKDDYSSDNLNPASIIFDLDEYLNYDEYSSPIPENLKGMDFNRKRKKTSASTIIAENSKFKYLMKASMDDDEETKMVEMSEEDINKSIWMAKDACTFERFEEICIDFSQQILDQVLFQVVHELS